ncbi:hypothetical protein FA950_29210 [Bacillus thuringiensis]|uniref:protease inhibitor I42 family protein n=1 Tax=Bacillus thuringiensis TaxID=1428 RepID=UPI0010ABCCB6|nr:protease inhibitor I42 family protein [Bacillus thuringiensis]TJZ99962.1 hypothetical protein FA950_29210 [Bacillus thuringiensis]
MYNKLIYGVLGITVALLVSGVSIPHSVKAEISPLEKKELKRPIIITKENYGEHIYIPMGQFFTISLSENPSTGYHWIRTNENHQLPLLAEYFSPNKSTDVSVENLGFHTFQFKASTPGIFKLEFKKWRDLEEDSATSDKFHVCLHIES